MVTSFLAFDDDFYGSWIWQTLTRLLLQEREMVINCFCVSLSSPDFASPRDCNPFQVLPCSSSRKHEMINSILKSRWCNSRRSRRQMLPRASHFRWLEVRQCFCFQVHLKTIMPFSATENSLQRDHALALLSKVHHLHFRRKMYLLAKQFGLHIVIIE